MGENFLDGEQCVLWNGTHTQQASWLPVKTTKRSTLSRSGMTYKPLTDDLGKAVFQSCLEAFPVRTYPVQEKEQGSKESDQVCGEKWQELLVKFNPASCSWKTHQCLWEEDLPESSVTLPKWGMMRDGVLSELTTSPLHTSGTGSGSWPTPTTMDTLPPKSPEALLKEATIARPGRSRPANLRDCVHPDQVKMWPTPRVGGEEGYETVKERKGNSAAVQHNLLAAVQHSQMWPTPTRRDYKGTNAPEGLTRKDGKSRMDQLPNAVAYNSQEKDTGHLNPDWVEWLMGWPIGWTDLNALETDKFRKWPHSHGDS